MRKNTMWNRLFHSKEIKANKQLLENYRTICLKGPAFIKLIEKATTLDRLLELHKAVYKNGFHKNLEPCSYGMFRCENIQDMNLHQVFLGGIWGLNTMSAAFWEQYVDEPYGVNGFGIDENRSLYEMIVNQYKNHILHNMRFMTENAASEISILVGYKY